MRLIIFIFLILSFSLAFDVYRIQSDEDIDSYFLDNDSEYTGLIICSVHGNEPLAYNFVKKMIYNPEYFSKDFFPKNFNYLIILQPSKYRINKNRRNTFEGFDPNRTFLNLFSKSSKFIVSLIYKYNPIFVIDIHQTKNNDYEFMYGFGSFCKIINNIYQVDNRYKIATKSIYTPGYYELCNLEEDLVKDSEKLFYLINQKISRYKVPGRDYAYDRVSILRNFAASKGTFSVLFEFPYDQNNEKNLEIILKRYLSFLDENKEKLAKYKFLAKKLEKEYFESKYFIIPKNYDNVKDLLGLLEKFGYIYYINLADLKDIYGLVIEDLRISKIQEFVGFIYFDIKIKIDREVEKKEEFFIIKQDALLNFLLNPIYGESVWNFLAVPFGVKYIPLYIYVKFGE
ncbi:MAG: hypothetical protein ACK4ZM_01615 [bacterium]